MSLDFSAVMKDMLSAAERVFAQEWPKVKDGMEQVLTDQKGALEQIASAYLSGVITAGELEDQLESERDVFEVGVAMCRVSSKVTVQRGVNAALDVLKAAVKAVV